MYKAGVINEKVFKTFSGNGDHPDQATSPGPFHIRSTGWAKVVDCLRINRMYSVCERGTPNSSCKVFPCSLKMAVVHTGTTVTGQDAVTNFMRKATIEKAIPFSPIPPRWIPST